MWFNRCHCKCFHVSHRNQTTEVSDTIARRNHFAPNQAPKWRMLQSHTMDMWIMDFDGAPALYSVCVQIANTNHLAAMYSTLAIWQWSRYEDERHFRFTLNLTDTTSAYVLVRTMFKKGSSFRLLRKQCFTQSPNVNTKPINEQLHISLHMSIGKHGIVDGPKSNHLFVYFGWSILSLHFIHPVNEIELESACVLAVKGDEQRI